MGRCVLRFLSHAGSFAWVVQVFSMGRERFRLQVRLLALAALVGIVAGLGAIVFLLCHAGCRALRTGRCRRLFRRAASRRRTCDVMAARTDTSVLSLAPAGDPDAWAGS